MSLFFAREVSFSDGTGTHSILMPARSSILCKNSKFFLLKKVMHTPDLPALAVLPDL